MNKKVLIIIATIITTIILFFTITFFNNKNKKELISINIYSSWLPGFNLPGIESKEIKITNNSSKEYKSIQVKIKCITDKNDYGHGSYKKDKLRANETINDRVNIITLISKGEISYCSTEYFVDEYSFTEWITHYFEK